MLPETFLKHFTPSNWKVLLFSLDLNLCKNPQKKYSVLVTKIRRKEVMKTIECCNMYVVKVTVNKFNKILTTISVLYKFISKIEVIPTL